MCGNTDRLAVVVSRADAGQKSLLGNFAILGVVYGI
jgi:hypothetical protein